MSSDENVKKIARFLENGGTMLASHCENCSAPLFRFKGEVICPVCSGVEAIPVSKETAAVSAEKAKPKNERAEKKKVRDTPKPAVSGGGTESALK